MMKRVAFLVLPMLILAAGTPSTSGADAEPARETVSPLQGKTTYINLMVIIKGYTKYQRFSTDTKSQVEKIELKVKKYREQMATLVKELQQQGVTPEEREAGDKRGRELQRQIEDLMAEGRSVVGRSSDSMMVEIYKDVREAVAAYARQEGIDAVLHYNDATPGTPEFYAPANVNRKLQAGSAMPIYLAAGVDITEAILNELNNRDRNRDE